MSLRRARPVSYTHLDVYKRQAMDSQTVFLEVRPSNRPALRLYAGAGFCEVGLRRGYYPVSYTHLDVYKRQAISNPTRDRRSLTGPAGGPCDG